MRSTAMHLTSLKFGVIISVYPYIHPFLHMNASEYKNNTDNLTQDLEDMHLLARRDNTESRLGVGPYIGAYCKFIEDVFTGLSDVWTGSICSPLRERLYLHRTPATPEACETPPALQEVIVRMKAMAAKFKNFGFGSLEDMNAFLETLPIKVSQETLEAIKALKPRESEENNSYTVFMKMGGRFYLGETAVSSRGADGNESQGVNIAATEKGKKLGEEEDWKYSKTGSAENLFKQLDHKGKLNFIRANKAMLPFLKNHNLCGTQVYWEWLSDPADSDLAFLGCAQPVSPGEKAADVARERRGVRVLRDVTSECS